MQPYSRYGSLKVNNHEMMLIDMWKNYLKIAIRNSFKDKYYIIIIVLELGVAMAFALIIGSIKGAIMTNQLLNFKYKYHISVDATPIIISAMIILLAAFLTTSATIYSAANTNPSQTLRDE